MIQDLDRDHQKNGLEWSRDQDRSLEDNETANDTTVRRIYTFSLFVESLLKYTFYLSLSVEQESQLIEFTCDRGLKIKF